MRPYHLLNLIYKRQDRESSITLTYLHKSLTINPSSQGYGFSSSHVWMWELDYKESWAPKNWCFWTLVLEKTFENPLDCKDIQPVHPKGDQSWVFIGRTDVEAETPILWPPDAKNWLTGKDPYAGKDWRWEEKGTTENEMDGWHHWLSGHGFELTLGVGDGQGSLACCSSWGRRVGHDWATELNWKLMINGPWKWISGEKYSGIRSRSFLWLSNDFQMSLWAWTSSTYLHEKDISIRVCPCMYHECLLLHVPAATGPDGEISSILRKERSFSDIRASLS